MEAKPGFISGVDVRRKIALRILPLVFILYIVSYLDRSNLSFAGSNMKAALGFNEEVYGTGVAIFFLGYVLLEVPGALIAERWSARKWLARILVTWGICASALGFVKTPQQFYTARFLLGLAEAGFFPAIVVLLSHWFPARDRARAMSGFILGIPISMIIGAPLSHALLKLNWLGWEGWRWMFVLEGIPAVVFGIITWLTLRDDPREVKWLGPEEARWIQEVLASEKAEKARQGKVSLRAALRDPNVYFLSAALFSVVLATYGFVFWLPKTIEQVAMGWQADANLYAMIPYGAALIALVAVAWHSDKTGERKLHAVIPLFLGGICFVLALRPGIGFGAAMFWLSLTGACTYAWGPSFWALPTLTLGESAAAAAVGFINMVGNIGGYFAGKWVGYLLNNGVSYQSVIWLLAGCFVAASGFVMLLRIRR